MFDTYWDISSPSIYFLAGWFEGQEHYALKNTIAKQRVGKNYQRKDKILSNRAGMKVDGIIREKLWKKH